MSRTPPRRPVVIVTGASSGIGRATAILLSQQGYRVVLAARSAEGLHGAQDECQPGTTTVVPTDVSDPAQVDALFAEVVRRHTRVDAVVHCAAVLAYGRFEDVPTEVFDASLAVTLHGTAHVARATLRHFGTHGGGRLVVVGSLLGKIATPYMSSYVTAKWAVHGLVRCLQIEARETPGIDISLVSPGGVDTPVYLQAGTYVGRQGRPPPPISSPEAVAKVIVRRLERPARETNVGVANGLTVVGFRFLPMLFDRIVTPLMKAGGLSRGAVPASPGNVLSPQPDGEETHGEWGPRPLVRASVVAAAAALAVGAQALRRRSPTWPSRRPMIGRTTS
ncbi:MAG: SDR family NAD(P)-dependent oxidoreductase [Lapillicoccus sp.]